MILHSYNLLGLTLSCLSHKSWVVISIVPSKKEYLHVTLNKSEENGRPALQLSLKEISRSWQCKVNAGRHQKSYIFIEDIWLCSKWSSHLLPWPQVSRLSALSCPNEARKKILACMKWHWSKPGSIVKQRFIPQQSFTCLHGNCRKSSPFSWESSCLLFHAVSLPFWARCSESFMKPLETRLSWQSNSRTCSRNMNIGLSLLDRSRCSRTASLTACLDTGPQDTLLALSLTGTSFLEPYTSLRALKGPLPVAKLQVLMIRCNSTHSNRIWHVWKLWHDPSRTQLFICLSCSDWLCQNTHRRKRMWERTGLVLFAGKMQPQLGAWVRMQQLTCGTT